MKTLQRQIMSQRSRMHSQKIVANKRLRRPVTQLAARKVRQAVKLLTKESMKKVGVAPTPPSSGSSKYASSDGECEGSRAKTRRRETTASSKRKRKKNLGDNRSENEPLVTGRTRKKFAEVCISSNVTVSYHKVDELEVSGSYDLLTKACRRLRPQRVQTYQQIPSVHLHAGACAVHIRNGFSLETAKGTSLFYNRDLVLVVYSLFILKPSYEWNSMSMLVAKWLFYYFIKNMLVATMNREEALETARSARSTNEVSDSHRSCSVMVSFLLETFATNDVIVETVRKTVHQLRRAYQGFSLCADVLREGTPMRERISWGST